MASGPKRPSMHESMLWTNVSGFLVAFLLALLSGHLFGGIAFCAKHPQVRVRVRVGMRLKAQGARRKAQGTRVRVRVRVRARS